MKPKWHILIGFTISYLLALFNFVSLLEGIIIFLSSFLIDVDHYIWYVYKKKNWNLKNAVRFFYNYGERVDKNKNLVNTHENPYYMIHSLPFLIILFFLGLFVNKLFYFIIIGMVIHIISDLVDKEYNNTPWYSKIFPCIIMIRNKNKKRLMN